MKKYLIQFFILFHLFNFVQISFGQDRAAIIASLQSNNNYFTSKMVETDFETTIINTKAALKEQGFGIVSEIDMQDKLLNGTGNEIPKYTILGACNPSGAYNALQIEVHIGVMLPCNVIVRETKNDMIEVAAINPEKSMQSIGNPEIEPLAKEISEKLKKVLASL